MRDGSVAEVRLAGVKHNDLLNKQNVLWNAEMQHAMVVDFENVDATDKKP
jgi:Ser/Thr protein kinase RdoA (MazF antagonist)